MKHPLTHVPALAMLAACERGKRIVMRLKTQFPAWLGMPILGPYVQFYRQDEAFTTQVSLFNYFSSFLPSVTTKMVYRVVAYRRDGSRIGRGEVALAHEQSAQVDLAAVIGQPLDAYGLFHVQAVAYPAMPEQAVQLGTTTGQFMTLYCPTDPSRQGPQMIHSHKLFQALPIPYSPYTRTTSFTEDISATTSTEFFFLNTCPTSTTVTLRVVDVCTAKELAAFTQSIRGHGVGRVVLAKSDLPDGCGVVGFTYAFNRRIAHMKPILFRHYPDGVITCNHT